VYRCGGHSWFTQQLEVVDVQFQLVAQLIDEEQATALLVVGKRGQRHTRVIGCITGLQQKPSLFGNVVQIHG
jgi:hypothetical protein